MMDDLGQGILAIFGGIVIIAIVSVIVGQRSQAPAAIQAATSGLAKIVAAAVNPAGTNAANPVSNNQAVITPQTGGGFGQLLTDPSMAGIISEFSGTGAF